LIGVDVLCDSLGIDKGWYPATQNTTTIAREATRVQTAILVMFESTGNLDGLEWWSVLMESEGSEGDGAPLLV